MVGLVAAETTTAAGVSRIGFDHEALVVIGEEAHLCRRVDDEREVREQILANGFQHRLGESVEIVGIFGDGEDKQNSLGVAVHEQERRTATGGSAADDGPGIVGEKGDLRDEDFRGLAEIRAGTGSRAAPIFVHAKNVVGDLEVCDRGDSGFAAEILCLNLPRASRT